MKTLYLSVGLLFFTLSAVAQTNFLNRPISPNQTDNYFAYKNKNLFTPEYSSLQKNMMSPSANTIPCFVPDISSVAAMPTLKIVSPQFIPNPYFDYRNFPGEKFNSVLK